MIWQAVGLQSPSPRRCFDAHWVCDIDPRCGHVLRGHAAERSIASTVSPTFATRVIPLPLVALQGASRRWAVSSKLRALASERLLPRKRCGEAMVEEMWSGLRVTAVGGNGCLDWSIMGKWMESLVFRSCQKKKSSRLLGAG